MFVAHNRYLISVGDDGTVCITELIQHELERKVEAAQRRRSRVHNIHKRRFEK